MRFSFDTEDKQTFSLDLSDSEMMDLGDATSSFIPSLAYFMADFSLNKLEIENLEDAMDFKEICLETVGEIYDFLRKANLVKED